MRLSRHQIRSLSRELLSGLTASGLVSLDAPAEEAEAALEKALTDDLMVEDRLDDEVAEILKGHKREIEQGRMDYNTMFELVKKKLIKERGLVL